MLLLEHVLPEGAFQILFLNCLENQKGCSFGESELPGSGRDCKSVRTAATELIRVSSNRSRGLAWRSGRSLGPPGPVSAAPLNVPGQVAPCPLEVKQVLSYVRWGTTARSADQSSVRPVALCLSAPAPKQPLPFQAGSPSSSAFRLTAHMSPGAADQATGGKVAAATREQGVIPPSVIVQSRFPLENP